MALILVVLLLALLLGGLGFAVHILWWIALIVLVIWLLGFLIRMGEGGSRGRPDTWPRVILDPRGRMADHPVPGSARVPSSGRSSTGSHSGSGSRGGRSWRRPIGIRMDGRRHHSRWCRTRATNDAGGSTPPQTSSPAPAPSHPAVMSEPRGSRRQVTCMPRVSTSQPGGGSREKSPSALRASALPAAQPWPGKARQLA